MLGTALPLSHDTVGFAFESSESHAFKTRPADHGMPGTFPRSGPGLGTDWFRPSKALSVSAASLNALALERSSSHAALRPNDSDLSLSAQHYSAAPRTHLERVLAAFCMGQPIRAKPGARPALTRWTAFRRQSDYPQATCTAEEAALARRSLVPSSAARNA